MCPTNSTTTMLAPTSTTTKEKQEGGGKEEVKAGAGRGKLLDKDWGAKIPDYISRSILSLLVFIMGLTMKVFLITIIHSLPTKS